MITVQYTRNCITFSIPKTRRLDFLISGKLQKEIIKEIDNQANNFIIDLTNIHFIDSHSFNVLLQVHNMLERVGKKLYIVNISESAKELFNLTGLDRVLAVIMEDTPANIATCQ